jgi:hypothetical protein
LPAQISSRILALQLSRAFCAMKAGAARPGLSRLGHLQLAYEILTKNRQFT